MNFVSDAIAEIEGLLDVNRDFCKKQMAQKACSAAPLNCAVLPKLSSNRNPILCCRLRQRMGFVFSKAYKLLGYFVTLLP